MAAAAAAGVRLLALTDHDTVDGVGEAPAARRRSTAIAVVPAVELSTIDELGEDLHILGYGIDHTDRAAAGARCDAGAPTARRGSTAWPSGSASSACRPTAREIQARRAAGLPVGRPHLANAVDRGQRRAPAGRRARRMLGVPRGLPLPRAARPTAAARRRPWSRRSRRSTPRAASPSGRIRSGTSTAATTSARRWSASAPAGWTASRRSTRRTTAARPVCSASRPTRLGLLTTGSADFHGPAAPPLLALPRVRAARLRSTPGPDRGGRPPRLARPRRLDVPQAQRHPRAQLADGQRLRVLQDDPQHATARPLHDGSCAGPGGARCRPSSRRDGCADARRSTCGPSASARRSASWAGRVPSCGAQAVDHGRRRARRRRWRWRRRRPDAEARRRRAGPRRARAEKVRAHRVLARDGRRVRPVVRERPDRLAGDDLRHAGGDAPRASTSADARRRCRPARRRRAARRSGPPIPTRRPSSARSPAGPGSTWGR